MKKKEKKSHISQERRKETWKYFGGKKNIVA